MTNYLFGEDVQLVVIDNKQPATSGSFFFMPNDSAEGGMSDAEIHEWLNAPSTGALVAGAGDHAGLGMVALIPTEADATRLAVAQGLPADELHVTLYFLGDVANYTPVIRDSIITAMHEVASKYGVIKADAFGVASFNSHDPNKDTCIVLNIGGDAPLGELHNEVEVVVRNAVLDAHRLPDSVIPEQHKVWLPHLTLTYDDSLGLRSFKKKLGPITFDRIRVAFGDFVTDIPLYSESMTADAATDFAMKEFANDDELDVYLTNLGTINDFTFGSDRNLRNHWVRGKGAGEIRWGTDGSFGRCVRKLGKYVKNPQGLCAEYHKEATGEWPAEKGVESSVDIAVTADAATATDESGAWEGILVVEGIETGDQRKFSAGALTWPDTKAVNVPLMWARSNEGEHKGSVMVGRIDKIWRDPAAPAMVRGAGRFDLGGSDGQEAYRQVKEGFLNGISIDPDQISDAEVELQYAPAFEGEDVDQRKMAQAMGMEKPTLTVFHGGRIRGATLVSFPAFVESQIALTNGTAVTADAGSGVVFDSWDQTANPFVFTNELLYSTATQAYAYVKPKGRTVKKYDCHLLHHHVNENGAVGPANMDGVQIAMDIVNSDRPTGLAAHERFAAYTHLAAHFREIGIEPPAYVHDAAAADLVACGSENAPPKEWFDDPQLSGPTPFTVTDDGRVFGHAALWDSCHTSFGGTCVTPPYESDYSWFRTGEVVTADGSRVAAGQITLGTSHAPVRGISAKAAIDHYGDTGTSVADVAAGTDAYGIWVAGALRPGLDPNRIHALRASALSGDWRRIGGDLRMVALLAVNVPGFPIPRTAAFVANTKQLSLVASGIPAGNRLIEAQVAALKQRVFGKDAMTAAVQMLRDKIHGKEK